MLTNFSMVESGRRRYRRHATTFRCLLLVCTARMSLCSEVTACNYHAWFGDRGLVTTLIRDQTQVPYNASQVWYPCAMFQRCCRHVGTALQAGSTDFVFRLFDCTFVQPDCLASCAEQLYARRSEATGNTSHNDSSVQQREAFMTCCVWFRMQLEVEDAKTAAYECCILHTERETAASKTTPQQTSKVTQVDCCVTSNLIAGSFFILDSEARDCDSSCAPWPREGKGDSKGLRCSCYNYVGNAKWQRIPGVEVLDLEVECAVEDCHFRLLEEEVRNQKHAWMKSLLEHRVFVNSTIREALTAVLRREQIDTELSVIFEYPLVKDVQGFLGRCVEERA